MDAWHALECKSLLTGSGGPSIGGESERPSRESSSAFVTGRDPFIQLYMMHLLGSMGVGTAPHAHPASHPQPLCSCRRYCPRSSAVACRYVITSCRGHMPQNGQVCEAQRQPAPAGAAAGNRGTSQHAPLALALIRTSLSESNMNRLTPARSLFVGTMSSKAPAATRAPAASQAPPCT